MADANEKVKRKQPDLETIKQLFVKSGNECAFPGCTQRIINQAGDFIAQICHIEAAEEGGERFNKDMNNDTRAAFPNLMLMCYEHHVITNNVEKYTVPVLQEMKADHEAKYTLAPEKIFNAIVDEASHTVSSTPKTFARFNSVFGWDANPEQVASEVEEVAELLTRLREVPVRTRQLLISIVRRAGKGNSSSGCSTVPFTEIVTACSLEPSDVYDQVKILDRYRIAYHDYSAADNTEEICLRMIGQGPWDIWTEIKEFCAKTGHTLDEFIIGLRFGLLD